ncbi:unnamed protein product [Arabidopsis lyrata]|nr:unnamed protein product [Arabidopsis lyrata]
MIAMAHATSSPSTRHSLFPSLVFDELAKGLVPKIPGRFYYYFGNPLDLVGKKKELKDKDKAQKLYLQVKSEVEECIAYLKVKRESDPYRNLLPRMMYQASHGWSSEIPTFDL